MVTTATRPRPLPWDVMGSALSTHATTVADALKESGLDFTVEVREAKTGHAPRADKSGHDARTIHTPAKFQSLVRSDTEQVLAFTKTRYTPIQNADAFAVGDVLTGEFGAKVSAATDFRNGERSMMVLDLAGNPMTLERDGHQDRVDLFLLMLNDHAGNAALTFALTPVRFACTNALPAAIAGAERVWKVSHTPNAQARVMLAQESILKAVEYREALQVEAQRMLDTDMVDAEFAKMVARLYPVKKDAEGAKADRVREIQATLMDAWNTSPTLKGIQGTRWAGYNVVTEYLDHFRPVRSDDQAVARAEGALDGPYTRQKANLWSMFAGAK